MPDCISEDDIEVAMVRRLQHLCGHDIVEFEQGGSTRAEYGKRLVATLAKDLTLRHGRGFSRSNVMMMRAYTWLSQPRHLRRPPGIPVTRPHIFAFSSETGSGIP